MLKRKYHDLRQAYFSAPFFILLVLILLTLILPSFLEHWVSTRILLDIFLTAILFALIFAIRSNRAQAITGVILALPLIITTWASYFVSITSIGLTTQIFAVLFFGYAAINILRGIVKQQEVSRETIFSAIVAYLMIGLMWAFLYMLLETIEPGSFSFPDKDLRTFRIHFRYFSFVTITTLGFGDILPLTNKASALAMLEALVGQIYLVVLVAWLVGMHVSRKSK